MDDLAAALFDALYEQRLVVAMASVALGVCIGIVAWRRGWLDAARRHPSRSAALIASLFAVGAPLTWYLASPIWIRTSLVDRKSTRLNSSHVEISYAVFCLKKK